ncbi:MAG: acylphosphatase [Bacteroidetes bacterium]|nr:MAG: acylphosphatase [Bacteroidota bacterium]
MLQTISVIVKGKVQGVYYRQSTREQARILQITGTVKNLEDGSVEIIATGTSEQLKQLTTWCRQGPSRAVVADLIITPLSLQSFNDFSIIR